MEKRKIIEVKVPKELWEADMSIWNWRRNIVQEWMKSVVEVVKQMECIQKSSPECKEIGVEFVN